MYIVLVTGSRTWTDVHYVRLVLCSLPVTPGGIVLYHGACRGSPDEMADEWAIQQQHMGAWGMDVSVRRFPAKWHDSNGVLDRGAGKRRNAEMVAAIANSGELAVCHAFIRGDSGGATHCAKLAKRAGIHTVVHRWEDIHAFEAWG